MNFWDLSQSEKLSEIKPPLKMVLNGLGLKLTVEEVDEMLKFADVENDGQISYEEFARMMPSIWYFALFYSNIKTAPSI